MAERYLWTPWDVDERGTKTWPLDFRTVQQNWKSDSSSKRTCNVHSLADIGRITAISGPENFIADHLRIPGIVDLGSTLESARAWVEADVHPRASEYLTHFKTVLAAKRSESPLNTTRLITRFLPDQLVSPRTSQRRGTFTETWTGSDGDPWPSHWTNTEMDTLDLLGSKPISVTIEIQNNQGEYKGPTGGPLKRIGYTFAYNGDEATDMNCKVTYEAKSELDGVAVRIENGGGNDSF